MRNKEAVTIKDLIPLLLANLILGLAPSVSLSGDKLAPTPENFDKLRALIKPQQGEDKWTGIPWMAGLWEARRRAANLGKPILLWEMDGNPLGCG